MRRIGISISSLLQFFFLFFFSFEGVVCVFFKGNRRGVPLLDRGQCVSASAKVIQWFYSIPSHWTLISRKREAYTCIEDATVMATFTYILHLYTLDYLGHFE
jgi:hypothetical protein